jgi:hypothetical protein
MSYLDVLRSLDTVGDFPEKPKSATVETVETPSKPSFDSFDSPPPGLFQNFDPAQPRRCWLVFEPGWRREVTYTPPATLPEVRELRPDATEIVPAAQTAGGSLADVRSAQERMRRGQLAQYGALGAVGHEQRPKRLCR